MDEYQKAEKKLNSWFNSYKYEEAGELFEKAANKYKIQKEWEKAGDAFSRAASCSSKDSRWEAALRLTNAGRCYFNQSSNKAIKSFQEASQIYLTDGNFMQAAKLIKDIAEMYEKENMISEALDRYREASDLYVSESPHQFSGQALVCLAKVAYYLSITNKYLDAAKIYEDLSLKIIDNNALKWRVKDYLFCAALCHFTIGDLIACQRIINDYEEKDASFSDSRECKFLKEILVAMEANDLQLFTDAVIEFDRISRLDSWKTSVLLIIKKTIVVDNLC